jgi:hypothetical protein
MYYRDILQFYLKEMRENLLYAVVRQHATLDVSPIHLHLFVSFPPSLCLLQAMKRCKELSSGNGAYGFQHVISTHADRPVRGL